VGFLLDEEEAEEEGRFWGLGFWGSDMVKLWMAATNKWLLMFVLSLFVGCLVVFLSLLICHLSLWEIENSRPCTLFSKVAL
jgi:hypothetical protein